MKGECKVRIGLYPFTIKFVEPKEIEDCDGRTFHNDRVIKIRNDLDDISTELVLRHEIVHAILGTQGRVYQTKFNLEEVCEFIAYKLPEINSVVEGVLNEIHISDY